VRERSIADSDPQQSRDQTHRNTLIQRRLTRANQAHIVTETTPNIYVHCMAMSESSVSKIRSKSAARLSESIVIPLIRLHTIVMCVLVGIRP